MHAQAKKGTSIIQDPIFMCQHLTPKGVHEDWPVAGPEFFAQVFATTEAASQFLAARASARVLKAEEIFFNVSFPSFPSYVLFPLFVLLGSFLIHVPMDITFASGWTTLRERTHPACRFGPRAQIP